MTRGPISRREILKGIGAASITMFASPIRAATPEPSAITPSLIAAAKKEGKVVHYSGMDVRTCDRIAKAFESRYPGISVRVERNGSERLFQRIGQEYSSNI